MKMCVRTISGAHNKTNKDRNGTAVEEREDKGEAALICISLALTEMIKYSVNWNIIKGIIFSKLLCLMLVGKAWM